MALATNGEGSAADKAHVPEKERVANSPVEILTFGHDRNIQVLRKKLSKERKVDRTKKAGVTKLRSDEERERFIAQRSLTEDERERKKRELFYSERGRMPQER